MNIAARGAISRLSVLAAALATVAVTAGLAAGSTTHLSRASASSGTTLTVWTMEDSKAFTSLVANFTKQTGINVNVQAIPWANVNDKLTTAVASGNGPDVVPVELTWQAGGTVQDRHGLVTFNTKAFKSAVDFYISFYKSKLVPTASDFDQTQGFISGAAPMVISGPYLAGAINGAAPELAGKWGVALLPKDKTGTSLFAGSNMGVWYKSKHVNESLRLLDYLSKPKEQLTWFKLTSELPTVKAALSTKTLTADPMVRVYIKQLQDAQLLPPLVPPWGKIGSTMLDALNSIVLKGADENSTLAQLNQQVAALQK